MCARLAYRDRPDEVVDDDLGAAAAHRMSAASGSWLRGTWLHFSILLEYILPYFNFLKPCAEAIAVLPSPHAMYFAL
jgi:hypothetical protein